MTAVMAERRSTPAASRAGMSTDLWFPGQQDPTAPPASVAESAAAHADPVRYVVWVPAGRHHAPDEWAPRKALHIGLRPSQGLHDCDGCRP